MAKTSKLFEYGLEAAKIGRILLEPEPKTPIPQLLLNEAAHYWKTESLPFAYAIACTQVVFLHGKAEREYRELSRRYRCSGKLRMIEPVNRCSNRSWKAHNLESLVWTELKCYLSNHDLISSALEKQRQDADQTNLFESELERVERQLKAIDREQHQLLQWALKDFPADQVEAENRRLNKAKETLLAQKAELLTKLKTSQEAITNVQKLESFIRDIQDKLPLLDFEGKRLALDMLDITVWLDGDRVDISGTIDPEESVIVNKYS